jgi:SAM-dependent methyltransferase
MNSPVYWSMSFYEAALTLALGRHYDQIFSNVAALIPPGASVLDLCCGTARLYRRHLKRKNVLYRGLEFNKHFVSKLRHEGINVEQGDIRTACFPRMDYVVMCSSFHLVNEAREAVFQKMMAAATKAVIISEPVVNLAQHPNPWLARLARWLSNPGIGDFSFRYNLTQFKKFCSLKDMSYFLHQPGEPIAIAIFNKPAPVGEAHDPIG